MHVEANCSAALLKRDLLRCLILARVGYVLVELPVKIICRRPVAAGPFSGRVALEGASTEQHRNGGFGLAAGLRCSLSMRANMASPARHGASPSAVAGADTRRR
jgi:hypothetical protein